MTRSVRLHATAARISTTPGSTPCDLSIVLDVLAGPEAGERRAACSLFLVVAMAPSAGRSSWSAPRAAQDLRGFEAGRARSVGTERRASSARHVLFTGTIMRVSSVVVVAALLGAGQPRRAHDRFRREGPSARVASAKAIEQNRARGPSMSTDRRLFLTSAASGALLLGCSRSSPGAAAPAAAPSDDDEVTPVEDLMREHGVLRRVMYLYDEAAQRFEAQTEVPLDALAGCAGIIRRVIEDYHEKLEEDFLFPRYEKVGKLAELTAVLRQQHLAGRALTAQIGTLAKAPLASADRAKLAAMLRRFNHMYRPHAAREDTVLFPALRGIVGKHEYEEMGDQFEDKEKAMLGDHGFEKAVEEVARLEQAFGVSDLAKLTA
jgi:hemerythrin-like domain-containing protein